MKKRVAFVERGDKSCKGKKLLEQIYGGGI